MSAQAYLRFKVLGRTDEMYVALPRRTGSLDYISRASGIGCISKFVAYYDAIIDSIPEEDFEEIYAIKDLNLHNKRFEELFNVIEPWHEAADGIQVVRGILEEIARKHQTGEAFPPGALEGGDLSGVVKELRILEDSLITMMEVSKQFRIEVNN